MWIGMGLPVLLVISTMPKLLTRRMALGAAAFFSVMLAAIPLIGVNVNGATRWIGVGFSQFQPSEFLKPFYIVALAWFFSLREKDPEIPVFMLSGLLTGVIGLLLMMQPDFGQTVMFVGLWAAMAMIAGLPGKTIGTLAGGGIGGLLLAYFFYPVANQRINNFLFANGDTYQVDTAHATITGGGFFGTGPGGGEMKFRLPEAHTDYIFSVIGEEFGLIACGAIAVLYLALGLRVFVKLLDEEDRFTMLAVAGLSLQLVMQAMINMAVNVGLAPSKGMTLPFISYGGSSFIALCVGAGMLLALTRKNPYLLRSPYVSQWSAR
jgi:cell division protein FtsW